MKRHQLFHFSFVSKSKSENNRPDNKTAKQQKTTALNCNFNVGIKQNEMLNFFLKQIANDNRKIQEE